MESVSWGNSQPLLPSDASEREPNQFRRKRGLRAMLKRQNRVLCFKSLLRSGQREVDNARSNETDSLEDYGPFCGCEIWMIAQHLLKMQYPDRRASKARAFDT